MVNTISVTWDGSQIPKRMKRILEPLTASGDMIWGIFLQVPYEQPFLGLPDQMFFYSLPQHTLPLATRSFYSWFKQSWLI